MANLVGKNLGRYHVLEQLGKGGLATIYKAYDTRLERDVAVKIIQSESFPADQMERILKRFERDAKALARLTHPNIVQVYDYGDFEGAPYLILEFVLGETLKEHLQQRKGVPMPWPEAVQLLLPLAQALYYAHDQGIVHRDIKPSNILITSIGEPMLSGFEIVKLLDKRETQTLTLTKAGAGTPEYVAPEQWKGEATAQTDLYALGVVLYEMVTGKKPYEGNTSAAIMMKQATQPVPQPRQYISELPQELEAILMKALSSKPEERFHDMGVFIESLNVLEGLGTGSATLKVGSPNRRMGMKNKESAGEGGGSRNGSSGRNKTVASAPGTPKRGAMFQLQIGLTICMVILVGMVGYLGWRIFRLGMSSPAPSAALVQSTETLSPTATKAYTATITPTATITFTPSKTPTRTRTPKPTLTPWPTTWLPSTKTSAPQVLITLINKGSMDKVIFMDGFRLTDLRAGDKVVMYIPIGSHTICWDLSSTVSCPRPEWYDITQNLTIVFSLDYY